MQIRFSKCEYIYFFNLPIYAGCLILFLFSEEKLNTIQKVNVRLVVSLPRKGISFGELRERENAGKRKSTNINEENC